jgi:isocitrate dehydrogenase
MTKDLALLVFGDGAGREHYLTTEEFLDRLSQNFRNA